jgi:hypothetical protein
LATMGRLDPEIAALNLQLASAADDERRKVAGLLKQRQEQLLPHYLKVAEQYADLHDVPARMLAKRCVHGIIDWNWSRRFFYGRLRRRVHENEALQRLSAACPSSSRADLKSLLRSLASTHIKVNPQRPRFYDSHELAELDAQGARADDGATDEAEELDKRIAATFERDLKIAEWLESSSDPKFGLEHPLNQLISQQRKKHVAKAVQQLVQDDEAGALDGLASALSKLSPDKRKAILDTLVQ